MKMSHSIFAIATLTLVALTGCQSKLTAYSVAKDEANAADVRAKAEQARVEQAQEHLQSELDSTPDWFLHPPRPDGTGMYAVGSGSASDVEMAVNKARLRAEFGLAKLSKKELTGNERDFQRDSGDATTVQYERLIDSIVQATIVGEETVQQQIKPIDGRVHVWVLMKLPYDEFNRVIQDQRASTHDETIKAAFDNLERRIDKRRQQALDDAVAKHAAAEATAPTVKAQ